MEIYNTLSRSKEVFQPKVSGKVGIYVCGPTTYNYIHLGNARPLVFFDTVRRYFTYKGYEVFYVQNFTDVDDKIINRAKEEKVDLLDLSARFIEEYYNDADALNVRRANIHPKVSEHIPVIIELIKSLLEKGVAYIIEGDVYFDVRKFPSYGKLSKRNLDEMRAGARVEVDVRKHDPLDFALWKAAKTGEPAWGSPWGLGRPGWHIECSAMALKYLGSNFDIHGGGSDLIFPHHENEIAQSEAATNQPFVHYWMHNGFITVEEEKMSKSLGNFFLVREILAKVPPELVRFYLLSAHYHNPLDFDMEKLETSGRGLERIKTCLYLLYEALERRLGDTILTDNAYKMLARWEELREAFEKAMEDDFNTALAISVLFDLTREVNSYLNTTVASPEIREKIVLEKALNLFEDFNEVLGIFKVEKNTGRLLSGGESFLKDDLVEKLLQLIIEIRQNARAKKDWPTSDKIREDLKKLGIIVEDTPQGVRWKKQ